MEKIRVLVVDDSALARRILCEIIDGDPGAKVIGIAKDGVEAIKKVKELDPDVVTLDLFMPGMDGLTALEFIMKKDPRPVLIISSFAKRGAVQALKALELGAVDFVAKPTQYPVSLKEVRGEILSKVRTAAFSRARAARKRTEPVRPATVKARSWGHRAGKKIVVIGASAGGPKAIAEVLSGIPGDLGAPVVIVQHMPEQFTASFASRLNRRSKLNVREAVDGERLEGRSALVVPGGADLRFRQVDGGTVKAELAPTCLRHGVSPVIDVTMESAAEVYGEGAVGVILSGMGSDGVLGLGKIKEAGGMTIAQDESTSLVFGMPKVAIERNFAKRVVPIHEMARFIVELV